MLARGEVAAAEAALEAVARAVEQVRACPRHSQS